jgi:glycosyltransferase involved in cell wall biosynthesis
MRVGFLGRFEPKAKGLDWLEKVLRDDARWRERFHFAFQGEGAFLNTLRGLSHRFGEKSVKVIPWGDTQGFLDAVDALILTSRFEGFPLVAVEALMAGVPVIATRESGLCEVLPDWCLFSFGDAAGMWAALDRVRDMRCRDDAIRYGTEALGQLLSEESYARGIGEVVDALRVSARS